MIRRRRLADVVARQLELFGREHAGLIRDCEVAEDAYDRADRDEAEERYGDYLDLVETAAEVLAELRDGYASTLDEATAAEYGRDFRQAVARRFPAVAVQVDDL